MPNSLPTDFAPLEPFVRRFFAAGIADCAPMIAVRTTADAVC
jgi:hypothetical protein